jgi:hypothetical protein
MLKPARNLQANGGNVMTQWFIRNSSVHLVGGIVLACLVCGELRATEPVSAKRLADDNLFAGNVLQPIEKFCLDCHGEYEPEAGVSFHDLNAPSQILHDRDKWEAALSMLRINGMPPHDYDPRPSDEVRAAMVEWLDLKLHRIDCQLVDDPGHVTIQRLNRAEYNNTVRDLLGIDFQPAEDFPADDVGYGFNNIGDVLSLPPLLFEKYLNAAERIADEVIEVDPGRRLRQRYSGRQLETTGSAVLRQGRLFAMSSTGSVYRDVELKQAGTFIIRVAALAEQAGPELAKMAVRVDGRDQHVHTVRGNREESLYENRLSLDAGKHRLEVAFINDYYNPEATNSKNRDRNLAVRFVELQGPLDAPPPEVHRKIVFTKPNQGKSTLQASEEIFARLMPRAFRRPVDEVEVRRVAQLAAEVAEQEESFERGVQVGLVAVLVSPHFLFRVELDPTPEDQDSRHRLDDYELASRLSYFIWSSMPDDRLFELAQGGELHKPEVLEAEVARMLADEKSITLVDNFASQWLDLGSLADVTPDPQLFPEFSKELRQDMVRETQLVIQEIFRSNLNLLTFLDADFTFVNQRLAKHYGISGVTGESFCRVALPAKQRTGVLTHASILTLTSNPNRTSLVRRGKWILDTILGFHLPDPPANVPALEDAAKDSGAKSLREQLAIHRESPTCASCHNTLDPLGFGFENFDAIGRWREQDQGLPIDAAGTLPSGEQFRGPIELMTILRQRQDEFLELVTRKMLTYALGRGLELPDSCAVESILAELKQNDCRFEVLVREIVLSKPFLMRRGEGEIGGIPQSSAGVQARSGSD